MPLTSKTLERCGVPAATARANLPFIKAAMREFDITTPQRARMFLAQVLHESMRLTRFEEIASGAQYEGNENLGNTQPGDGVRFKGRGPIQITGRWNYTHFGNKLKLDLVRHPEKAAEPRHGWRLSAAYFDERGCNNAADRDDFEEVTRLINGALSGLGERQRYYRLLENEDVLPGKESRSRVYTREEVLVMTRRLSLVRAKETGKPYLDGMRTRVGAKVKRALRSFQADHELVVDGRYGPKTLEALARAAKQESSHPALRDRAAGGEAPPKVSAPDQTPDEPPKRDVVRGKLASLAADAERLDVETNRAWRRIVAHGTRRQSSAQADDAAQLGAILLRIEEKLASLVELEQRGVAGKAKAAAAEPVTGAKAGPPMTGNGAGQPPPVAASRSEDLDDLSDAELGERIERLERTIARSRKALIRRYSGAESLLAKEVEK